MLEFLALGVFYAIMFLVLFGTVFISVSAIMAMKGIISCRLADRKLARAAKHRSMTYHH